MANINVNYSQSTTEINENLKNLIPETYYDNDTEGNLATFLLSMSEMIARAKMNIDELFASNKVKTSRQDDILDTKAPNFGLWMDRGQVDYQKSFVDLASRWIDRKGTDLGMQSLIASYNRDSDINEIKQYYPVCGDAGLLCGDTTGGTILCGVDIELDETSAVYGLGYPKSLYQVKLENYNADETAFNNAIVEALSYVTPLHIQLHSTPIILKT